MMPKPQTLEVDMFPFRTARVLIPLAIATLIAAGRPATAVTKGTAGKKLAYEQAWAFCKAQLDKRFSWDQHSQRYAAGGSCMLRFGYRI
jgi:hypothetical protein